MKKVLSLVLVCLLCLAAVPAKATVIDVLVIYDSTARGWVDANGGGMTLFAEDALARMDQAAGNSQLDLSFHLAHAAELDFTFVQATMDLCSVLQNVQAGFGDFAPVRQWRDTYGADVVAFFVDTGSAYGNTGCGYLLTSYGGSPAYAYSAESVRAVADSHTLTHEVGHLLGAAHSKFQLSSPGPNSQLNTYSAGWYFTGTDGFAYHTIMAYNADGHGNFYSEAPLFSSPLIQFQGASAGHALDGDNVRTLRETVDAVAGYRPSSVRTNPDPFVFVDQVGVPPGTWITSNTITVTGINAAAPISVLGGTYSVSGGAFTGAPGTVNNGATVTVRALSPASYSTTSGATLTVGAVSDTFSVTTPAAPPGALPGAFGAVDGLTHRWKAVPLDPGFTAPVVIASPPTYHGADPGVVRLRSVTPAGFEVRFQEWDYLDRRHLEREEISYLVFETGHVVDPQGVETEAGTFSLRGTGSFHPVDFSQSFSGVPALFLTVQTANGGQAVAVRVRNVTESGFRAALFEQEAFMGSGHAPEEVGYLAIFAPAGSGLVNLGGINAPFLLQSQRVNSRFTPVLSHTIKVEEEQSLDAETDHGNTTLDLLILDQHLFAQEVRALDDEPCALRRLAPEYGAPVEWGTVDGVTGAWSTVPLFRRYQNPVVVVKPVSGSDADPGTPRVRRVRGRSFEVKFDEWSYLDGSHGSGERLFYLVAEAGSHDLGGLTVQAGALDSTALLASGQWEAVTFPAAYPEAPAVFTSVMTHDAFAPVVTRVQNVGASGFEVAMQQEESRRGPVNGTLGWIAVSRGETTLAGDPRRIKVMAAQATDAATEILFGLSFERQFPVLIGEVASSFDPDPCVLRHDDLKPGRATLRLQEEQSADPETVHGQEELVLFLAE